MCTSPAQNPTVSEIIAVYFENKCNVVATCWDFNVKLSVDCVWNVMTHAQKPDFVFRWNGRVHLNWRGRQFSRLLAAEVCASAAVMLDTPCSEVVWRVLFTHHIHQFPLHFPSRESPCVITFQLDSTYIYLPLYFQELYKWLEVNRGT
jgi:hypothetical protein